MDMKIAIDALGALAHERRLRAFRLLVQAGTSGLPAGEIAERLDIPNNTLSTHLAALTRAGLLNAKRDGRHIWYRANFDGMRALLGYLLEDCCKADPALVEHTLAQVQPSCCASTADMENPQ